MDVDFQIPLPEKRRKNITSTVKAYGNRLWSFIRDKVNSNEDAEDILQEVWFQLSNLSDMIRAVFFILIVGDTGGISPSRTVSAA